MRWVVGLGLLAEAGAFSVILPSNTGRQQVVSAHTSSISRWTQRATSTSRTGVAGGSSRHGRYKTNLRTAAGLISSRKAACGHGHVVV